MSKQGIACRCDVLLARRGHPSMTFDGNNDDDDHDMEHETSIKQMKSNEIEKQQNNEPMKYSSKSN